ncbi:MAG: hypothetical protein HY054_05715 [Proteobacteria bacterium]|nr:hypothetical protein [Pseudomonadota bacterium]
MARTTGSTDPYAPPPMYQDKSGRVVRIVLMALLLGALGVAHFAWSGSTFQQHAAPMQQQQQLADAGARPRAEQIPQTQPLAPAAPQAAPAPTHARTPQPARSTSPAEQPAPSAAPTSQSPSAVPTPQSPDPTPPVQG